MAKFGVLLLAAGESARFGGLEKKPYANLLGRAVWLYSLDLFAYRNDVVSIVVVVAEDDRELFDLRYRPALLLMPQARVVVGGATRGESVARGLAALDDEATHVCVHDAARPCVSSSLVSRVLARGAATGAAILARPVTETLKRVVDDRIVATVPRDALWLAETPQVFRRDWLTNAQQNAANAATDDASLIEAAGHDVHIEPSDGLNVKLTYAGDMALAAAILNARRPPPTPPAAARFDDDVPW